jgi:hypothetical protein
MNIEKTFINKAMFLIQTKKYMKIEKTFKVKAKFFKTDFMSGLNFKTLKGQT